MQFGPGLLVTFLYYFSSTAVIFTLVASRGMGLGTETGIPQAIGVAGGLLAGGLGTYFNRTVSWVLPLKNKKKPLIELENVLTQMGYENVSEALGESNVKVYDRTSFSKWVSGKVYVQTEPDQVTIASRASTIRRLQQVLK